MSHHVFRRIGPTTRYLRDYLPPSVTVSVGPLVPEQLVTIELSDDGALEDLRIALDGTYEYVGLAPNEGEG